MPEEGLRSSRGGSEEGLKRARGGPEEGLKRAGRGPEEANFHQILLRSGKAAKRQ